MGDTELGGQQIKAGDALIVGIAPANTDPAVRPDLSVNMEGNRAHLAFSSGPHECPGQDIGRAIADVGVDALLMRLPDLELGVDEEKLKWAGNFMSRHLVDLPAGFAPTPEQEIDAEPLPAVARSRSHVDWEVSSPVTPRGPMAAPVPAGVRTAEPQHAVPGEGALDPGAAERADEDLARRRAVVERPLTPAPSAVPGAPDLRVRGNRLPGPYHRAA